MRELCCEMPEEGYPYGRKIIKNEAIEKPASGSDAGFCHTQKTVLDGKLIDVIQELL